MEMKTGSTIDRLKITRVSSEESTFLPVLKRSKIDIMPFYIRQPIMCAHKPWKWMPMIRIDNRAHLPKQTDFCSSQCGSIKFKFQIKTMFSLASQYKIAHKRRTKTNLLGRRMCSVMNCRKLKRRKTQQRHNGQTNRNITTKRNAIGSNKHYLLSSHGNELLASLPHRT